MQRLPLGIQNIREILSDGYVYSDKTQYVYNLINGVKYYFLSRPRRFGKSLLLDTIGETFGGDRELFKGLWIYDSDYEFSRHPVLRFDMSNIANDTPEILRDELSIELRTRAKEEGIDFDYDTPSAMFKNLIVALFKKYGRGVVVLIDEYDKPILDRIDDTETAEANRKVLGGFYGILKSMDRYLRLTFITGITKISMASEFSGLNNLLDITLMGKYANICGIVPEDLDECFSEHIGHLSKLEAFANCGSIRDEILYWYGGYSWGGETRVINPFSLLSFFAQERFAGFWFASGTPKFLMDLIKKDPSEYVNMKYLRITESMLDTADIFDIGAELLLFQTGYLTIKEVIPTKGVSVYLLDMPNFEVREAFNLHVATTFTGKNQPFVNSAQ